MRPIADWDDAYANAPHIPGGADWPERWPPAAAAFRERHPPETVVYGPHARERLDLFRPEGEARGLAVFVHGGYWMRLDRSDWSHLAAGALARGWAVAMPSYPLAPEARIAAIARSAGRAVKAAAERVAGPIRLSGHSAGGHLVARLMVGAMLPFEVARRVERVLPVSGLFDLRPLLFTEMNGKLGLDLAEACAESPALLMPRLGTRLVAWVGQAERAEFVRQSALIANIWRGCGAATDLVVEPDRHHFDVIEALADPGSPLVEAWLGEIRP